jgi:hypothetical protein
MHVSPILNGEVTNAGCDWKLKSPKMVRLIHYITSFSCQMDEHKEKDTEPYQQSASDQWTSGVDIFSKSARIFFCSFDQFLDSRHNI